MSNGPDAAVGRKIGEIRNARPNMKSVILNDGNLLMLGGE